MNIIVAVDENWAIGNRGGLLVQIPSDQKFFREITNGKVVVMGRKTLATLPQGQPLAGRTNIILTRNQEREIKGAVCVYSIDELMETLKPYDTKDVFVIGGEEIYTQLLPYCDTAHVTKIDFSYQADAHFPNLDRLPEWQLTADSDEQTYFDLAYYFYKYERKEK